MDIRGNAMSGSVKTGGRETRQLAIASGKQEINTRRVNVQITQLFVRKASFVKSRLPEPQCFRGFQRGYEVVATFSS